MRRIQAEKEKFDTTVITKSAGLTGKSFIEDYPRKTGMKIIEGLSGALSSRAN